MRGDSLVADGRVVGPVVIARIRPDGDIRISRGLVVIPTYRQNVELSDLFLVEYMVERGVTDVDRIFAFVSDLRTDEAATVERVRRRLAEDGVDDTDSAAT